MNRSALLVILLLSNCFNPDLSTKLCQNDTSCAPGYFCDASRPGAGSIGTCSLGSKPDAGPVSKPECTTAKDCISDPQKPTCDMTTQTCRGCRLHAECESMVCVKDNTLSTLPSGNSLTPGMCVPATRVLTVDDSCGSSCSLQTAVDNASSFQPYVLMKNYTLTAAALLINAKAGLPELHIITSTADSSPAQIRSPPTASVSFASTTVGAIQVTGGASVTIEGLVVFGSNTGVMCDSNKAGVPAATSVTFLRSVIGLSRVGIRTKPLCKLTLDQCFIGKAPQPVFSMVNGGNLLAMDLDTTEFTIVNSVLSDNRDSSMSSFGGIIMRGSSGRIVNTTFYGNSNNYSTGLNGLAVVCPSPSSNLTIFNTLFVNPVQFGKPHVDPNCRSAATFDYIATDEPLPLGGGAGSRIFPVSDSALVDPTNGDFRLKTTAPSAVTTGGTKKFNGVTISTVDARGTPHPATTVAIGAFEGAAP